MFNKDYFPTMKAPDIAKQKILQYIYQSPKSLSKRYYFYRVYAPAFLLFFIFLGGLAFYNTEFRPINKTPQTLVYNQDQELLSESPAMQNFVSNKETNQEQSILPKTANTDENIGSAAIEVNKSDLEIAVLNTDNSNNITNDDISSKTTSAGAYTRTSSNFDMLSSTSLDQSLDQSLQQQISEIEILIDDISSITVQEENLF